METLRMIPKPRVAKIGALAMVTAATLALSPVLMGNVGGVDQAYAHPGGGGGGGNGNGGGGNGNGNGNGHSTTGTGQSNQGAVSSELGGLNAAHASKTALSHANPHSRVGRIAAYNQTVTTHQSTAAQLAAAQAASNKTVTAAVISALNGLLGNK